MHFFHIVLALFGLWLSQSSARVASLPRYVPANSTSNLTLFQYNQTFQHHGMCTIIDEAPEETDPSKFNITLPAFDQTNRDEVIKDILKANPNTDAWTLFIAKTKSIGDNITQEQNKALAITKGVVKFEENINIHIIDFLSVALKFGVHLVFEPGREWPKIVDYFKNIGKGIGRFFKTVFTKKPKDSSREIFGGLMLAVVSNPSMFVAQTGLMVAGGWNVINGFIVGLTAMAIAVPEKAKMTIMSVLTFIQCIDDPVLLIRPILQTSGEGIMHTYTLNGTRGTIGNRTVELTGVPLGSNLSSYLPQLPTCLLPPEAPAYKLRYEDFCDRTSADLVWMIFGVYDRRSMDGNETIEAWSKFQDFTCCYGPTNLEMQFNETKLSIPTVASQTGCKVLYGTYYDYSAYYSNDTTGNGTYNGYNSTLSGLYNGTSDGDYNGTYKA